jgi:uncharacterized protein YciI
MPYAIQTVDKPGTAELRLSTRPAHLEYLTARKDKILAGGALLSDDGNTAQGGIILLDTEDRQEAERFAKEDPFTKAGLFEKVTITRWRKAFFNKERVI